MERSLTAPLLARPVRRRFGGEIRLTAGISIETMTVGCE